MTLNQINSSSQAVAALRSKSVDVAMGPAGVIFDTIAKGVIDFTIFRRVHAVHRVGSLGPAKH